MKLCVVLLTAAVVAFGCTDRSQDNARGQQMQTLTHSNGLAVRVDAGVVTAAQIERGFTFAPADAGERRTPWSAELTLEPGGPPGGSWPKSRDLAGRSAHFRVDEQAGGSGGSLFVLNAWTVCGAHHLALRLEVQADTQDDAEFEPGWALLSAASCP